MEEKLKQIFEFFKNNRKYNQEVQYKDYKHTIGCDPNPICKVENLLYYTLYTQSQPKIDSVSEFFHDIHLNQDVLSSFEKFIDYLWPKIEDSKKKKIISKYSFETLFEGLCKQAAWGQKTSALFAKTIYHTHICSDEYKGLKFWNDVPNLTTEDKLYLPVDAVIMKIFSTLLQKKEPTFNEINSLLMEKERFKVVDMEVWDDLWFWGFITQKVEEGGRKIVDFNEKKYWSYLFTNKDETIIREIKNKAKEFVKLLLPKNLQI